MVIPLAQMDEQSTALELARRLREARMSLGISLRQVETETGVFAQQVNRIENAVITKPAFGDIVRLADFYGLDLGSLGQVILGNPSAALAATPRETQLQSLIAVVLRHANELQLDYLLAFLRMFIKNLGEVGGESDTV